MWTKSDEELDRAGQARVAPPRPGQIPRRSRPATSCGCRRRIRCTTTPTPPTSTCCATGSRPTTPNVFPTGRNGMHSYNNQDHSMLTAMLSVENILLGAHHDVWTVNVEAEYHEEHADPSQERRDRSRRAGAPARRDRRRRRRTPPRRLMRGQDARRCSMASSRRRICGERRVGRWVRPRPPSPGARARACTNPTSAVTDGAPGRAQLDTHPPQHLARESVLGREQTEQQVLATDVVVRHARAPPWRRLRAPAWRAA